MKQKQSFLTKVKTFLINMAFSISVQRDMLWIVYVAHGKSIVSSNNCLEICPDRW